MGSAVIAAGVAISKTSNEKTKDKSEEEGPSKEQEKIASEIPKSIKKGPITVNLKKFTEKIIVSKEKQFKDPDSKWRISPERSKGNPNGGSAWKLLNKAGKRIATLNESGKILRQ